MIELVFFTSVPKDDVLEVIKNKPRADESLGERSVLQVDAVIELVEAVFESFILAIGFFPNRRREALESSVSSVRINIFLWKLSNIWP